MKILLALPNSIYSPSTDLLDRSSPHKIAAYSRGLAWTSRMFNFIVWTDISRYIAAFVNVCNLPTPSHALVRCPMHEALIDKPNAVGIDTLISR